MSTEKILAGLNDKQVEAVVAPFKPVVVIAGAGAGKTTVLTRRAAYCIEHGILPEHIVAITFTNKAAREMRERLVSLLGPGVAEKMHIQTFHSFCHRILRANAALLGGAYDSHFSVLDDDDHAAVIKDILKELDIDTKRFKVSSFVNWISEQKDYCRQPKDIEPTFQTKMKHDVYTRYEEVMSHNNSLDFDDLLCKTYRIFKDNPSVLSRYQNAVHALLIDEAQDTNDAQYKLSKMLADGHRNLFVVGDSDQAIYGFRHANLENFLGFQKDYPDCELIKLEQNYRSTGTILDATNQMISCNQNRFDKELWTASELKIPIIYRACGDEDEEARWIVAGIRDLAEQYDLKWSDFCVLYRQNNLSTAIEQEFLRKNVPYHIFAGLQFLDRAEIKDVLAFVRVAVNPRDMQSLGRIVNVPARGVGGKTKEKVLKACEGVGFFAGVDAVMPLLGKHAAAGLYEFKQRMSEFIARDASGMILSENLNRLIKDIGYLDEIERRIPESEVYKVKLSNLDRLFALADEYDQNPTLEGFLDHIALSRTDDGDIGNKVSLMTCHRAKGLEYPAVFVAGMDENILPSWNSVMDADLLEEERRVAYVAMTRAKRFLYLSSAGKRLVYGNWQRYAPSRFIDELPDDLLSKEGDGAGWRW